jgi:AraC family transcriptional regulator, transcriptional activator FtrA
MVQFAPSIETSGPLVVALVYDGLCTFEFAIAAEIFGLARPEMGSRWYRFASAAIEEGPLRAHGGLAVTCDGGLAMLRQADIIVVPGWKGAGAPVPEPLVESLREAAERGARIASICSGAFVLAAAGLLQGKRAATHWRYAESLSRLHPELKVDASVLYVEEGRILTSAGSAAGIDLMLHIVRQDFGVTAANMVARRLVMPPHRSGGQAQYIERPVPAIHAGKLSDLIATLRAAPSRPWTVEAMAREATMSTRTFLRRFTETTGLPPGEWLTALRLEEAKRLLEATALSMEDVATRAGFGSLETMRHHFRKEMGLSPRGYRDNFA